MEVSGLRMDAAGSRGDFPRGYSVTVSLDGKTWSAPVAKGAGTQSLTEVFFAGVKAKHIRITQTGQFRLYWSIHDLQIYGK